MAKSAAGGLPSPMSHKKAGAFIPSESVKLKNSDAGPKVENDTM